MATLSRRKWILQRGMLMICPTFPCIQLFCCLTPHIFEEYIHLREGNETENSIWEDIACIIYTVGMAAPRSSAKQVGFCKRYREKGFKLLSYTPAEPCGLN